MNQTFLRLLGLFLLLGFCAQAASPTYSAFRGKNGILITTNVLANTVDVDGSQLTNGAQAVFVTTNLFVQNNLTVISNAFINTEYVTNLTVITNFTQYLFTTNLVTQNISVTSNAYFNQTITTNLTILNITTNLGVVMDRVLVLAGGVLYGTNHFWTTNLVGNLDVFLTDLLEGTAYWLTVSNPATYQVTWNNFSPNGWVFHPGVAASVTTNGVSTYLFYRVGTITNGFDFGRQLVITNGTGITLSTNADQLVISMDTNVVNGAATNLTVILSSGTITASLTHTNTTNFWTLTGAATSFGMVRSNIFTTNVQGSPVTGTLWFQGNVGDVPTNGTRTALEYAPTNSSLRIGAVGGNGQVGTLRSTTSTYSNYWDPTNIAFMTFAFGSNHLIRGMFSTIAGGDRNAIETNAFLSFIGGGSQNFIGSNAANSVIAGGTNNNIVASNQTAVAKGNSIGGGGDNVIRGAGTQFGTVAGGFGNNVGTVNAPQFNYQYCFIGGGINNIVSGDSCVIAGGSGNTIGVSGTAIGPSYATIGGGNANFVSQQAAGNTGTGATIGGGQNNAAGDSASGGAANGTISGGSNNKLIGNSSTTDQTIAGGSGNFIGANSGFASISGGKSNQIQTGSGPSFIVGGTSNNVNGVMGGIIGFWETNATASTIRMGFFDTNSVVVDQLGLKVEGLARTRAGKSTTYAGIGGTISVNTTPVENAGTAETNLMTFSIPAHALTNTNDRLLIRASGKFAPSVGAKQLKLVYGSETLWDSSSQVQNGGTWVVNSEIIRTGNTAETFNVDYHGSGTTLFTLSAVGTAAQTNGIATTLKLTGTAAATSDLTNVTMTVTWSTMAP